jgi:AdoMet-dependent heme synthase
MYKHPLVQIFLGITYKCNLNCKHCYVKKINCEEISFHKIKKLFDELYELGVIKIVFSHGESFLRTDFYKILNYCNKHEFDTTLLTNGTLLNYEQVKKLKKSKISKVLISLDSLDKNFLKKLRGRDDILEKLIKGMELLAKENILYGINTTINESSDKSLEDLVIFAINHGATEINFLTIRPHENEKLIMNKKNFKKYSETIKKIWRFKKLYKDKIAVGFHDPLSIMILKNCLSKNELKETTFENECLAGQLWASIQPSGDVQPCNFLPIKLGNIMNSNFSKIWTDSEKKRTELHKNQCKNCLAGSLCRGGCKSFSFFEEKNINNCDPRCLSKLN